MSFLSDKAEVRSLSLKKLETFPAPRRSQESQGLCRHLEAWWVHRGRPPVWAFSPFRQEPDLESFFQAVWAAGYPMGFPRIEGNSLVFHTVFGPLGPWRVHRWGMKEPEAEAPLWTPGEGVVLVPGLAFDLQGGRMGRGGGFYDRLLSVLSPQVYRLGLGFSCQVSGPLPREPHDQRMDGLLTPDGVRDFGPGAHPV